MTDGQRDLTGFKIMKKYTAYITRAFERKTAEGGLVDCLEIEIIANSEKEAMDKLEKLVKRNEYRIDSIVDLEQRSDEKYSVFVFQCHDGIEDDRFANCSIVEAIAENSEEAEKIVRSRILKKNYRLWKIIEKYANS